MITLLKRAALLTALLLTAFAPPAQAAQEPQAPTAARSAQPRTLALAAAVEVVPLAAESRDGYERSSFKHWNAGAIPSDGCNTRAETLIAEAVDEPQVLAGCKLSGGRWWSYYDAQWFTSAAALDIDHMVPLAEAWDSGASLWTAERREAYANDLGAPTSLVAVSAASNRSKADQDPAQWLPPATGITCRYASEWVATKLRWGLTADPVESQALARLAEGCLGTTVSYEPVA
ncbi:HNH endonuclease family protein [Streptomyces sp. NPDC059477]|uniref:HNH endonuclease family protein n=1 Tax=Streptomyces sp. NPDC059477 TaxID=3346847 RepID=UPI003674320E